MGIHFLFFKRFTYTLLAKFITVLQLDIIPPLFILLHFFFKGRVSLGTVDHHGTTHITQVGGKLVAVLLFPASHVL